MASKPTGRPRTKPADERRDELMTAAERLFLQKGVEQTTVEDVTSGAAVSKGAFYLHFSSKHDLVEAMRTRFIESLLARLQDAVGARPDDDWNGKLRAWSTACAVGYIEATPLHRILFAAAPSPAQDGLTRNVLIDDLAGLLTAGRQSGAWTIADPAFSAVFLFNALHGIVTRPAAAHGTSRERMLQDLEEHFHRIVR